MSNISPAKILLDVANSIPSEFHKLIVVVGSLAAGFHYFGNDKDREVRTKDIDCVVSPRVEALKAGKVITEHLLEAGWEPKPHEGRTFPASPETPDAELPVIRLYPPKQRGWFLEFLTVPDPEDESNRQWMRVELKGGHAGLGDEELDSWPQIWVNALRSRFPTQFDRLALTAGDGLRALLASENDLEQATHTCNHGLLVDDVVTTRELNFTGRRFMQDVIETFEQLAL